MDKKLIIDFKNLPVYTQKYKILDAVAKHQVVVVESNTGSGKTTQIPVILHEAEYTSNGQIIGITQPRRIAAFSISDVISNQLHFQYPEIPDNFVGYKIRFDDKTTTHTRVKVMTDGILLQEIKHDKILSAYSVLVIDEAHERSLNIDFIMGLLHTICKQRPDLKIIISSATINTEKFSQFFNNAPVIRIDAPLYPVDICYLPIPTNKSQKNKSINNKHSRGQSKERSSRKRDETILEDHIVDICKQSLEHKEGDILIFMSGEKNIKNCLDKLSKLPNADNTLHLLPLYGRLDQQAQEQVFFSAPKGKTKIIVATNIAETSITIDNISVVIDSGRAKLNYFHYHKLTSTLLEVSISKASATQRRGRAGRTKPGICYRIYSEDEFKQMEEFTQEEILRTDLSEIVLRMAHLGIHDYANFKLVSAPPKNAIATAVALLQDMRALDQHQLITKIGMMMIEFPLSPAHARILVETMELYPEVLSRVLIVLSFLTTPNPFLLPINKEIEARHRHNFFSTKDSDFLSYIKLFDTYTNTAYIEKPTFCERYYLDLRILNEIVNVHTQLSDMVVARGVFVGNALDEEKIMKTMVKGLMYNICVQQRGSTYLSRTGEKIYIHPGSMMFDAKKYPTIVVAGEIVQTSKTFARSLSEYKLKWLEQTMPYLQQELKKLLPLLSNFSHLAQQKLKAKIVSPKPLFSISKNSILDKPLDNQFDTLLLNCIDKKRDSSFSITLAKQSFALSRTPDNKHKVLFLSWAQVLEIMKHDNLDEIRLHNKLRCNITYNVHAVLYNIKLINIPIMFAVYGKMLPFTRTIKSSINLVDLRKKSHITHTSDLLTSTMHILIPPSSKQSKHGHHTHTNKQRNIYKFLALEINNLYEICLIPEGSFIGALQTSLHALGLIDRTTDEFELPLAIKKQVGQLYSRLRHAYEFSSG